MGLTELLTVAFVVLKLVGVISWNWGLVLLPEILAFVFYSLLIIPNIVLDIRLMGGMRRKREKK